MTNMKIQFTTGVLASMLLLAVISMAAIPDAYAADLKCENQIISGLVSPDNIVVPKNKWCVLEQVTTNGNLILKENSKADVFESTINGQVEGKEGTAVYLSDSFVKGNVNVGGEVVIEGVGDNGLSVRGNVQSQGPDDLLIWFTAIQGNIDVKKKNTAEISQSESLNGNVKIDDIIGGLTDFALLLFDNIFTGNVTIEKSSTVASVSITNNEITGSLAVKQTQGPLTLVEFNEISQDATCENNANIVGEPGSNLVGGTNKGCP